MQFDNFDYGTNYLPRAFETANGPDALIVTPQNGPDGIGFAFSNLGLSFSQPGSNVTIGIDFDVTALSGAIDGALLGLGTHAYAAAGENYATFGDEFGSVFTTVVADPVDYVFGFPARLTDTAAFADLAFMNLYSAGSAVVSTPGGFGAGTASTDGYTVLLALANPAAPGTPVPEPASLAFLSAGLALLWLRRRRA